MSLTALLVSWSTAFQPVKGQSETSISFGYTFYDLNYVASNLVGLNGTKIATRGIAKFLASIYMFEKFWLQDQVNKSAMIPIVVAPELVPAEDALIEVLGTIENSTLEGGFF